MAAYSTAISCCCHRLGPPAPPKESCAGARRPHAPAGVSVSSSHALRRACVVAAACAVIGMAGGGGGGGGGSAADMAQARVVASKTDAVAVGTARAKATPPRWSDRRRCPPWRANSLENIVPENLPRPSAHRRLDSFSVSAAEGAAAAPDLVAPPSFLAPRPVVTGCFSL